MALLSLLYLTGSDIFTLINYVGFATWLSIGVAVLCLPWLRWTQPNLPRPIKVNLIFPIIYIIASIFVTVVPMIAKPKETGYGCLMILSSVPVYLIFISWKQKPRSFQQSLGAVTHSLQKLMMVYDPKQSSNDSLPAEGSDGCGEGKACPGVKDIPQDGLSILIPWKLFCMKEMAFHYLNLDTYLIIFS